MATVKTIKPGGGGDYPDLATWEAWADDQATADQWAECYSGGDLGIVEVYSWSASPGPATYPRIYVADGEGHDGTDAAVGAYITVGDWEWGVTVADIAYVRVEGLRIDRDAPSFIASGVVVSAADNALVDGVLIRAVANAGGGVLLTSDVGTSITNTVQNCIVFGSGAAGSAFSCEAFDDGFGPSTMIANFYNCTSYGSVDYMGFQMTEPPDGSSTTATLTNCVSTDATVADFGAIIGSPSVTATYCVSSDDTADDWGGAGNKINKAAADCFETPGTNVVPVLDGELLDAGTTIASVTTDAIETARPQWRAYDIGAIEYVEATHTDHADIYFRGSSVAYETNKYLTEAKAGTLATAINDAMDAAANLDFDNIVVMCSRNDDTPGS